MRLGFPELILIIVLVLLLFGGSKIPTIMENFGKGLKMFKKEVSSKHSVSEKKSEKSTSKKSTKVVKKVSKSKK